MSKFKETLVVALAALVAGGMCLPVQAASVYDLRALAGEANWGAGGADTATLTYRDFFNNGIVQTGATYSGGLLAPASLYTLQGTATGAETTPGDYTVEGQPLGQFRFSQANATAPAPLVFNGTTLNDQSQRLRMNGPTNAATGVADTLFRRDRVNFAGSAAWDFALPDAGTRYGLRFTDAGIGATFNDLISMDVVNIGGEAVAQMRRLVNDASGAITPFGVQNQSFASGLFTGHGLADIDLVAMHLYWHRDTGLVTGELEMLSLSDGGNTIDLVGSLAFTNGYAIFRGAADGAPSEEGFTRLQAGASWTLPAQPVPEPSTYALMAVGLGALGWVARRRRAPSAARP